MDCSNHACKEKINTAGDQVYHTCSLCRQPVYCSEECRLVDWAIGHACPNVVAVAEPLSVRSVAVPYYYEDCLRPEDVERLPANDPIFSSYSFMYHDVSRRTETAYVSPKKQELQSTETIAPGRFLVRVTTSSTEPKAVKAETNIAGEAPHDVIFKGNRSNAKASAVAAATSGQGEGRYWLHDGIKKLKTSESKALRSGQWLTKVGIELFRGDEKVHELQTTIDLGLAPSSSAMNGRSRAVAANYEQHLGKKFQGEQIKAKSLSVWRAVDPKSGCEALITTRPLAAGVGWEIVDLEISSPIVPSSGRMTHSDTYHVDVRDYSQMNGLIMAIETELAQGTHEKLSTLSRVAPSIRKYVLSMADEGGKPPQYVSPEVKSAVNTAIETLYAPIGLQPSIDYWRRKMLAPYEKVRNELYALVTKMNQEREKASGKRGLRKVFGRLGKSINLRKLQAAATALGEFITRLRNPDLVDCAPQVIQQYQELQDLVIRSTQDVVEVPET